VDPCSYFLWGHAPGSGGGMCLSITASLPRLRQRAHTTTVVLGPGCRQLPLFPSKPLALVCVPLSLLWMAPLLGLRRKRTMLLAQWPHRVSAHLQQALHAPPAPMLRKGLTRHQPSKGCDLYVCVCVFVSPRTRSWPRELKSGRFNKAPIAMLVKLGRLVVV
jgi:hypothetical protein